MSEDKQEVESSQMTEQAFMMGKRLAYTEMLTTILPGLEVVKISDYRHGYLQLLAERQETLSFLREACEIYGDNDWPDTLHLRDVIEKHLLGLVLEEDGSEGESHED